MFKLWVYEDLSRGYGYFVAVGENYVGMMLPRANVNPLGLLEVGSLTYARINKSNCGYVLDYRN